MFPMLANNPELELNPAHGEEIEKNRGKNNFMSDDENIEPYHWPENTDSICLSCDVNRYLNSHKVHNADCCRFCENISYLHPTAEEYYKARPEDREVKVYCTVLGLMMNNTDTCKHFKTTHVYGE